MLKSLLSACLIVCMIELAPSAMAASLAKYPNSDVIALTQEEVSTVQRVQQSVPEKSSRIFGGGAGACIFACLPAFGTPAYAACRLACLAIVLKQE